MSQYRIVATRRLWSHTWFGSWFLPLCSHRALAKLNLSESQIFICKMGIRIVPTFRAVIRMSDIVTKVGLFLMTFWEGQ